MSRKKEMVTVMVCGLFGLSFVVALMVLVKGCGAGSPGPSRYNTNEPVQSVFADESWAKGGGNEQGR